MSSNNQNFNLGNIGLQVIVQQQCPMIKNRPQGFTVTFNSQTLAGLQQSQKNALTSFGDGITLKQRYSYLDSYLFLDNSYKIKQDGQLKSLLSQNQQYTQANGQYIKSWDKKRKKSEQAKWITNQSWIYKNHPAIQGLMNDFTIDDNIPVFSIGNIKFSDTVQGQKLKNNAQQLQIQSKKNQNIAVIKQTSVSTGIGQKTGVYWGLYKTTGLFKGQDFFLEFMLDAVQLDSSTPKKTGLQLGLWKGNGQSPSDPYTVLNPYYNKSGKQNQVPQNSGIVKYQKSGDTNKVIFKAIQSSRKTFDMAVQPHIVIQIGSQMQKDCVFILIFNNAPPTALIKTKTQNESYFYGELRSQYSGLSGASFFKQKKTRITFRNYLDKLVVIFNGHQSDPWIIPVGDTFIKQQSEIPIDLSVFGGNLGPIQFLYSPITYDQVQVINTPGVQYKKDSQGKTIQALKTYSCWTGGTDHQIPFADFSQGYISNKGGLGRVISANSSGATIQQGAIFNLDAQDGNCFNTRNGVFKSWKGTKYSCRNDIRARGQGSSLSSINVNVRSVRPSDARDDVSYFVSDIRMASGSHNFPKQDTGANNIASKIISILQITDKPPVLKNCKPVIFTQIHYEYDVKQTPLWPILNKTITNRVLSFNDQWSAGDYSRAQHSGSISFLMNEFDQTNLLENKLFGVLNNQMTLQQIKGLQKRNFFIKVKVRIQDCSDSFAKYSGYQSFNIVTDSSGNTLYQFVLFTGYCNGGTLTKQSGKYIMNCTINDYSKILSQIRWFNAPFFSGVRDNCVIYNCLKYVGFSDNVCEYIKLFVNGTDETLVLDENGFQQYSKNYTLPQSLGNPLQDSKFKPSDGSPVIDIMTDCAKRANKLFLFDNNGKVVYQNRKYDSHLFSSVGTVAKPQWFWSDSHLDRSGITGSLSIGYKMQDTYQSYKIIATTPRGQLIISTNLYTDKITGGDASPNNRPIGFSGFNKHMYQAQGIFGSQSAMQQTLKSYSKFRNPPVQISFQSQGMPVKALDMGMLNLTQSRWGSLYDRNLVTIKGFSGFPFIITRVSSTIDPNTRQWKQKITGQWIFD